MLKKNQIPVLIERLNKQHPEARYELDWETPLQLLVGTILAAQCTDERVNQTTPALFAKYADAKAFAEADRTELEGLLRPTGFYQKKAKTVQEVCQALVAHFKGEVPKTMAELVQLPGVARKTANVVLNNAFRIPSGIIVDTHVARVAPRMGLAKEKKPEKIEKELMQLIPREEWVQFGPAMVLHGRYTCTYLDPNCNECAFSDMCPRNDVASSATSKTSPKSTAKPTKTTAQKSSSTTTKKPTKKPVQKKPASPKPKPEAGLWSQIPSDWQQVLLGESEKPYFVALEKFVAQERASHSVYPPAEDVFNALRATPFDQVKVVLLGQDPYHDDGQAHGLAFSVRPGVKPPPSLVNMFKELKSDLDLETPTDGCLIPWAERGVLLLNTSLTVRAHEAGSHAGQGWEQLTDAIIRALSSSSTPRVFLLWGGHAQKKESLIDTAKHRVLRMAHPSPLSAKKFMGSKPYSQTNQALTELGREPIDWNLSGAAPRREVRKEVVAPPVIVEPSAVASQVFLPLLPVEWLAPLRQALESPSYQTLQSFLAEDMAKQAIVPDLGRVFHPMEATTWNSVRVVLLGEEPDVTSDGLAWSQVEGSDRTPTQKNLFTEACTDLGYREPTTTSLKAWAGRGVLLWNAVATRREARPGSHVNKGWEDFTRALLKALSDRPDSLVFALLGPKLARYRNEIDAERHTLFLAPHPDQSNFLGCRLFSHINEALELRGQSGIWWQLPAL